MTWLKNVKTPQKPLLILVVLIVVMVILSVNKIEVIAPGEGITAIKESSVVIKSPESSYVIELPISQGAQVQIAQPLLVYRNIADDYKLKEISSALIKKTKLLLEYKSERCFLVSNRFSELGVKKKFFEYQCKDMEYQGGAGGQYILQFFEDYLQEKLYIVNLSIERKKNLDEIIHKRTILRKKRAALKKGGGETIRFYDLDSELSTLNDSIIQFTISELESEKKAKDKLVVFQKRRYERLLTLDENIEQLESDILEKEFQKQLLAEKRKKSIIRSPIRGSVLEMTEGLSVGSYLGESSPLFTLKKDGSSQEVEAKFDSRYRHFLRVGGKVRLKINAPGFNKVFDGSIVNLSSDSVEYEESFRAGKRYYRVTINPDKQFKDLELNMGIDVQVYVVSREVSALEYILSVLPNAINFNVW